MNEICVFCNKSATKLIDSHVIARWFCRKFLKVDDHAAVIEYLNLASIHEAASMDVKCISRRSNVDLKARMSCQSCEDLFTKDDEWLKVFLHRKKRMSGRKLISLQAFGQLAYFDTEILLRGDTTRMKKFALGFVLRLLGCQFKEEPESRDLNFEALHDFYINKPDAIGLAVVNERTMQNHRLVELPRPIDQHTYYFSLNEYIFVLWIPMDSFNLPLMDIEIDKLDGHIPFFYSQVASHVLYERIRGAVPFNDFIEQQPKAERQNIKDQVLKSKN